MNENIFPELISFIREQIRESDAPMTRETLIEDGLGVTGEEAEELIMSFSKRYKVDITNFIFANYFYDEPSIFSQTRIIKPFTIGALEKAIIAGRLDDEVISS